MPYFPDMKPCTYFAIAGGDYLLAVGWLEGGNEFPTGNVPEAFYRRLEQLLADPWQPFVAAGFHQCSICQFDGVAGGANIFIPSSGRILVAPSLILHYINCHHYRPPAEFVQAVLECPDIRSMDYKKKLLAHGRGFLKAVRKLHVADTIPRATEPGH